MNLEKNWLNPISDINYENYEQGLLKSYQLGFQDPEWYKKNKDNFCNSLLNYPKLLPDFVKSSPSGALPGNYLGFYPDEFIRYGFLEQVKVIIENNTATFWVVRIPTGLQLYHSSRSLGLNHSDFPIPGYSNQNSLTENKTNVTTRCPSGEFAGHQVSDIMQKNVCTYVSYYSTPLVTKEYLTKTNFMGNQINYAYGIAENSNDIRYNDRLRIQSDEYNQGVTSYQLTQDTYFVIFALDDYLVDRPDLGRENMRTFRRSMTYLSARVRAQMNMTEAAFQNFLKIIDSVSGIGSIQDNIDILSKDYKSFGMENYVRRWLNNNADFYLRNPVNTAGYIRNTTKGVMNGITDLRRYKGLRFSTYEHDRPVMNMLGWILSSGQFPVITQNNKGIKISGFVSSSMFVPTKNRSELKSYPFVRQGLYYYVPYGVFHSEVGMFFAPDVLKRNRNNRFDLDYSINYEGINEELRKYKTTNITHIARNNNQEVLGFHQGHLFEHSNWVSLLSAELSEKIPTGKKKDLYLIAGYLHDIGKSGECVETSVYKGLNIHDPKISVCSFVKSNQGEIVGMKYLDIPEHPEKGYEFLKGYKPYKKYTLSGLNSSEEYNKNAIIAYGKDWEEMFDHLNVSEVDRKYVRIAVATHWYYGHYINILLNVPEGMERSNELIQEFLRKIEIFYNDEFPVMDKREFLNVIKFVLVISLADVLGSEYNPTLEPNSLSDDLKATIINYLPNIHQTSYLDTRDAIPVIEQLVNYALTLQDSKKDILNNVRNNLDNFLSLVVQGLQTFVFNPFNNYSILWNLMNSYVGIDDIKRAYPEQFPTVITFDLDQTLFRSQFTNNGLTRYFIYEDTYQVIQEIQKIRKDRFPNYPPTYIAITSRHYSPKSLISLMISETYNGRENPLYYKNFDFIISRYTGSNQELFNSMRNVENFFEYNGYPSDGFVMDVNEDSFRKIPDDPTLEESTKFFHFKTIKNRYNVEYDEILSFDDDSKYFTAAGLGDAEDVTVAGVLASANASMQGIRMPLFRAGIAYYVFYSLTNQNQDGV